MPTLTNDEAALAITAIEHYINTLHHMAGDTNPDHAKALHARADELRGVHRSLLKSDEPGTDADTDADTNTAPDEDAMKDAAAAECGITRTSLDVLLDYAGDAGNWSGSPLVGGNVGGTKEERGNLTQLKKAGLISTWVEEGNSWVDFTPKAADAIRAAGDTKLADYIATVAR